jgi:hypothetical protein
MLARMTAAPMFQRMERPQSGMARALRAAPSIDAVWGMLIMVVFNPCPWAR